MIIFRLVFNIQASTGDRKLHVNRFKSKDIIIYARYLYENSILKTFIKDANDRKISLVSQVITDTRAAELMIYERTVEAPEDVLQRVDRKADSFPWNKRAWLPSEECDRLRKVTWRGGQYVEIKKPWEERHLPCVLFRVTAASLAADLEALAWGTLGSHEGVLGFDSGFEEPSKTPRTTFHGSPLDFNATCTHAYVRKCVRRFATEYAGDRAIARCTRSPPA